MTRQEWLEWRKRGITGTDISAIMGLNPWKSPLDVWNEKKGLVAPKDDTSPAMERGTVLEPIVINLWEKNKGLQTKRQVLVTHPDKPHHLGSVDAITEDMAEILEVKCPNVWSYRQLQGKDPIEAIPTHYQLQLQWYLHCVPAAEAGRFIFFSAEKWEMQEIPIERDVEVEEMMVEAAERFWRDFMSASEPPRALLEMTEAAGRGMGETAVPSSVESISLDGAAWQAALSEYAQAKEAAEIAKAALDDATKRIKSLLAAAGNPVKAEGLGFRINYKPYTRSSFDTNRLKSEKPDLYKQYVKQTTVRPLRITQLES